MKIVLWLVFFLTCQVACSSVGIINEEQDCPICFEPLEVSYPRFYQCTHNIFHDHCVFSSPQQLSLLQTSPESLKKEIPFVESCPICRSPSRLRMTPESHAEAIASLRRKDYYHFSTLLYSKLPSDEQIVEYVAILIFGNKHAIKLISTLHVKEWSSVLPLFKRYITKPFHQSDLVYKQLIQLGDPSESHQM